MHGLTGNHMSGGQWDWEHGDDVSTIGSHYSSVCTVLTS